MSEADVRPFTRRLAILVLAGVLLCFAVFSYPLFTGRVYIEDDLSAFNLPLRYFYHQCLHKGDSPMWIPSMFCGFYLHSEGQAGMWHPLHYGLYRFLPLGTAFNLELIASYLFLFPGIFLLLRRRAIPAHAALLGAALFTFCGFNLSNYLHIMIPAVAAHTPWLLLCIDVLLCTPSPRAASAASVGVVLLTASQLLLGFPQSVYLSLAIEGLYVLFLLRGRAHWPRVIHLGAAKCIALLCGAVQLLPQMGAVANSVREAPSFEFIMAGSLHPANWLQLVSPYLFNRHGWTPDLAQLWDPPYFTAIAPVCLVWVIIRFRALGRHKALVTGAAIMAAAGVILAMGYYGYLYRAYAVIPWLNKFRNSSRHVLLVHLALSAIVAVAYADLIAVAIRRERVAHVPWLCLPAVLSVLVAAGAMAVRFGMHTPSFIAIDKHLAPAPNIWMGTLWLCGASALAIAAARHHRLAIPILVVFTFADIGLYGLRHKPSERLDTFVNGIEVPGDCAGYRIDPDFRPVWAYNAAPMRGYAVVSGYSALFPHDRLDYRSGQLAALRAAGCRWRKTRLGGPADLAEAYARGIPWLEVPAPMPRVRCVTKAVTSRDPAHDIATIDLASTVLADETLELPEGPQGRAAIMHDRPGDIEVAVDVPGKQLLVVSERNHAGWQAYVDNHPAAIHRVNGDFMACIVDKGQHMVRLAFDPSDLKTGKWVSLLGLGLTLLFGSTVLVYELNFPRNAAN